jgi:hypothetical protein
VRAACCSRRVRPIIGSRLQPGVLRRDMYLSNLNDLSFRQEEHGGDMKGIHQNKTDRPGPHGRHAGPRVGGREKELR